jgi:trimeric autotransporter adhesin
MSTKTISKRVALATVVALGAGVLSLVSVSSASATNATPNLNVAPSLTATNPTSTAGTLNIASLLVPVTDTVATSGATVATGDASYGLLSVSDIAGGYVAGTTQTATLLAGGGITVYTTTVALGSANAARQVAALKVTGGTISGAVGQTGNLIAYGAGAATAAIDSTSNAGPASFIVKPNSGATSMTIQLYTGSDYSATGGTWGAASTSSAGVIAAAASPTTGTLEGQINVSIATSSVSGTLSVTKSGVYYSTGAAAATSDISTPLTGQPAVGTSAWNVAQYASIVAKDAYGVAVPSGVLTATATNGAYVSLVNSATAASAGTSSSAFVTGTNGATLTVAPSVSTASSTTVTVSYNGTVIGTKAFTFNGKVASVVLSAAGNGKVGGAASNIGNSMKITFKDSAGTVLAIGDSGQTGSYPASAVTKNAGTAGTGISLGTVTYPTTAAAGKVVYGCGAAVNVTGTMQVDYSNIDGTVVTSNSLPVSCSGVPYSYTAKLDKASYNPGDIATLSVTFKDSNGALAADVYTLTGTAVTTDSSAIATAANVPNVIGSNLTNTSGTATTAGSALDVTTNGVATYKFIVGSTAGSYQAIVSFPAVDTGTTVAYTIASSGTSLNDVLKGIVSLIASINKQIAALAKLVTKK